MDITVKPYDPSRREEVLQVMRLCLGEKPGMRRDARWWEWRHEQNPFGRSLVLLAEVDGQVAGVRPFMRWELQSGGSTLHAVKPVDTVTHPAFQRKGIFSLLTRAASEQAASEGVQLLFNTPNHNSLPGYLKLGWERIDRLPLAVKVLRPLAAARRIVQSLCRADEKNAEDKRFRVASPEAAAVLTDAEDIAALDRPWWGNGDVHTQRTAEFLRWRYAAHPHFTYHAEVARDGEGIAAAAFFRARRRRRLREVMLDDLFVRDDRPDAARQVLQSLCRNTDADYIVAHFPRAFPLWPMLRRFGFFTVPKKRLDLVARHIGQSPGLAAGHPWALTFADIEGL